MPNVESNANYQTGVGLNPGFELYCRDFASRLQKKFNQVEIRWAKFENWMPLVSVGSADHVILPMLINGDNWLQAFAETAISGSAFTIHPDKSGSNCKRLSILFPFADLRQDQRTRKPVPDSADAYNLAIVKKQFVFNIPLANMLKYVAGANDVTGMDMHSFLAYRTFIDAGLDTMNLTAMGLCAKQLEGIPSFINNRKNTLIGTTDFGDLNRAVPLSNILNIPIAVVKKWRIAVENGTASEVRQELIYGNPRGKQIILVDDMVSGGGTLKEGVRLYESLGAESFIIFITHAILVGDYYEKIQNILRNPKVKAVIFTNTIPLDTRFSGVVSRPYIGMGSNRREVTILDTNKLLVNAAGAILNSSSIAEAKNKLGNNVWDMQDPYDLACQVTGINITKPQDAGIYAGEGVYINLDNNVITPPRFSAFSSST
jgi:phosphoribosylpyrophosphate synthetase